LRQFVSDKKLNKKNNEKTPGTEPDLDNDKRRTLRSMSSLAAYVAPAMTVLLSGDQARAHHRPWHTSNCDNFPNSPFCASTV
jgi:hypothetical protein